ncbi:hypothetical protein MXB_1166, partial [Myxobolus squamalis]
MKNTASMFQGTPIIPSYCSSPEGSREPYSNDYPSNWQAKVMIDQINDVIIVCLMSPVDAGIGYYTLVMYISSESTVTQNFFLTFNPWCPECNSIVNKFVEPRLFKLYSPECNELIIQDFDTSK